MTANDKFRNSWSTKFMIGIWAAVAVHFAIFTLAPSLTADDYASRSDDLEMVYIPPEVEIPPPPAEIQRPATPVIADVEISEDITISETTFEANPVDMLPPPPDATAETTQQTGPRFIPREVDPVLKNRREIVRVLQNKYPPLLRDSGIEGRVILWLFIGADGAVTDMQLFESSGYDAMDRASYEVAEEMEFSPAMNRDQPIGVWVQIPITFTITR